MKGCKALSEQEVKALLASATIRDKALFLTGLTFGTRISESLSLTFGDMAGKTLYLKSKKGSDNQVFPIPANYKAVLNELKAEYESIGIKVAVKTPLFVSRKGNKKAITRQQASQIVKKMCVELGIEGKVNSHSFRKSFVTRIYEMTGFNIAETKKYSRHKNLANLDYYISTTQGTELVNELVW